MEPTLTDPGLPAAQEPPLTLPPELIPNIEDLEIEDGKPVDSLFTEQQQRLLVESGYSWAGPADGCSFKFYCNVGFFIQQGQPALVPDVMLSLGVDANVDLSRKENRSYLLWVVGKPPDVVIELVSDRRGGEASLKQRDYARVGVSYYAVFDPNDLLGGGVLRVFELRGGAYAPIEPNWLPNVGIGLVRWDGVYEGQTARWLRWCDRQGQVLPTGRERADNERQQKERLRAQLRALGVEPEV